MICRQMLAARHAKRLFSRYARHFTLMLISLLIFRRHFRYAIRAAFISLDFRYAR